MKRDWIFLMLMKRCLPLTHGTGPQRMFLDYSVTFTAEDFRLSGR